MTTGERKLFSRTTPPKKDEDYTEWAPEDFPEDRDYQCQPTIPGYYYNNRQAKRLTTDYWADEIFYGTDDAYEDTVTDKVVYPTTTARDRSEEWKAFTSLTPTVTFPPRTSMQFKSKTDWTDAGPREEWTDVPVKRNLPLGRIANRSVEATSDFRTPTIGSMENQGSRKTREKSDPPGRNPYDRMDARFLEWYGAKPPIQDDDGYVEW